MLKRIHKTLYVGATFTVTTEETADENSLRVAFSCEEYLSGLGLVVPFQVLAYKIATGKGIDLSQKISVILIVY